jgi:hypothetical protein
MLKPTSAMADSKLFQLRTLDASDGRSIVVIVVTVAGLAERMHADTGTGDRGAFAEGMKSVISSVVWGASRSASTAARVDGTC